MLAVAGPEAAANEITRSLCCGKHGCECHLSERRGTGKTHCPVHNDPGPSLNVSVKNGDLLVKCHADCPQDQVLATLRERGLWPDELSASPKVVEYRQEVETYDYCDEQGAILFQVVRYVPKTFRQRQPDGRGGFIYKMDGVRRVPYRLPDVISGDPTKVRFIVEGERDVERLRSLGLIATTNPGGAGKWAPEYAQYFRNFDVVILPDNDEPGRQHALQVAPTLTDVARSWKIVTLPHLPAKGDVSDWLSNGGSRLELKRLIETTVPFEFPVVAPPTAADQPYVVEDDTITRRVPMDVGQLILMASDVRRERTGIHAKLVITLDPTTPPLAWSNFNVERDEDRGRLSNSAAKRLKAQDNPYPGELLKAQVDDFCQGLWQASVGSMLPEYQAGPEERETVSFFLYPFVVSGGGTIIFAPPGRGKSFILLLMAVCMDAGIRGPWPEVQKSKVLFINLERSHQSVLSRLANVNEALGLPRTRPLAMLNKRGHTLADVSGGIEQFVKRERVECVFLDSISRAGVGDLTDNVGVNRNMDLMNRLCPTWVALGHSPRADDSHVFGGIHFDAAADLMVQLVSQQDDDGPLGVGLNLTKNNDVGKAPQWVAALDFDDTGLTRVREARRGEFIEVEQRRKMTMKEQVKEYLRVEGKATASEIGDAIHVERSNVARLLSLDSAFVLVEKNRAGAFYALRD